MVQHFPEVNHDARQLQLFDRNAEILPPDFQPMTQKRYSRGPRWMHFMNLAQEQIKAAQVVEGRGVASIKEQLACAIMDLGHGQEFLKAVRRGRSTQRQNLRYLLLREVEKFCGNRVKRRRKDANTPDALALRTAAPDEFKLEAGPVENAFACGCPKSDAWKCAVVQRLATVSCHCPSANQILGGYTMIIAKTCQWFFVYDDRDCPIAAFPERELAEMYNEGCGWTIREQLVTF